MHRNQSTNRRTKIIVIVGPTASGKSDLGIKLAQKFNGEIISADSRQVYRGMDIGTGKITKKEQQLVPHYLLDIASPKKIFTVSDFKKLGEKSIKVILNKNKIPFIVGGAGFYIDALIKDTYLPEIPADKKLRKKLDKFTAENLFKMLQKFDPRRAKNIDGKNKRRLIRALEIIKITGKSVPKLKTSSKYDVLYLGINPAKNALEKKIKLRLETRLRQGMIKEVINLQIQGLSWKRLDDLGLEYRWISRWLIKNLKIKMKNYNLKFKNSDEYTNLLRDIIHYSKRQMTWFKRNKKIHWIKNRKEAEILIRKFISHS